MDSKIIIKRKGRPKGSKNKHQKEKGKNLV
jgi:hypothetical protein